MKLKQLLKNTSLDCSYPDLEISGVTSDSREVAPGFLFATLDNGVTNGIQYIPQAIKAGARVILTQAEPEQIYDDVLFLTCPNPNKIFGLVLKNFYNAQPQFLAAITGTNGKTSIADFVRQMIFALGYNAASMGTLGLIKNNQAPLPFNNTTPGAMTIHHTLSDLKKENLLPVLPTSLKIIWIFIKPCKTIMKPKSSCLQRSCLKVELPSSMQI